MKRVDAQQRAGMIQVIRGGSVSKDPDGLVELLTIEEVAERLRVSVLTVRWLRQEGRFMPAIKVGRRLMWDTRDVAAWLEAQRETPRGGLMGVQRYTLPSGAVRYRARVKSQGREVATRVFERKADAVAWEQDQRQRLRLGEWIDPRRGQVRCRWWRRTGSVRGARSSAGPGRAMRRRGGTTSDRVSATGRWPRSRRRRCRAGSAR